MAAGILLVFPEQQCGDIDGKEWSGFDVTIWQQCCQIVLIP